MTAVRWLLAAAAAVAIGAAVCQTLPARDPGPLQRCVRIDRPTPDVLRYTYVPCPRR